MRKKLARSVLLAAFLLSFLTAGQAQFTLPAAGVISTMAGAGVVTPAPEGISIPPYAGNGGPAALHATLNQPSGVAVDLSGNIYIADLGFSRILKITNSTGILTSVAGNGTSGSSGDGGLATSASISLGVNMNPVVDAAGDIYFIDATCRVREVAASTGNITTVVGNGICGYSGDGGPATLAEFNTDQGLAVDQAGNIYIADTANYRVRKVSASNGNITTVAGNGTQICCGRSMNYGDGGPATSAEFSAIRSVAVDVHGNIYVADIAAQLIREVTASTGTISTVVGNGTGGYSGDGGPATSAEIDGPSYVVLDPAGNIYFYDAGNFRIRKVMAGIITTVAGNGTNGFSVDGGLATSSEIAARSLAVDAIGNFYFSEYTGCCVASSYINDVRVVAGNAVSGFVNPKYVIVGVTYAPPGPSSYVQYSNTYFGWQHFDSYQFILKWSCGKHVGRRFLLWFGSHTHRVKRDDAGIK